MKRKTHRCPDCHKQFQSDFAVENHRIEEQGDCFNKRPAWKRQAITRYRQQFQITPPPVPYDPDEGFQVIE